MAAMQPHSASVRRAAIPWLDQGAAYREVTEQSS